MTLGAKHSCVWLGRHEVDRVLCMLGLGTMASLAGDSSVFAFGLYLEDICMAGFAGFMPGVDDGQSRHFRNSVAAVMSVFPKTVGDEEGSNAKERQYPCTKQDCDAE